MHVRWRAYQHHIQPCPKLKIILAAAGFEVWCRVFYDHLDELIVALLLNHQRKIQIPGGDFLKTHAKHGQERLQCNDWSHGKTLYLVCDTTKWRSKVQIRGPRECTRDRYNSICWPRSFFAITVLRSRLVCSRPRWTNCTETEGAISNQFKPSLDNTSGTPVSFAMIAMTCASRNAVGPGFISPCSE